MAGSGDEGLDEDDEDEDEEGDEDDDNSRRKRGRRRQEREIIRIKVTFIIGKILVIVWPIKTKNKVIKKWILILLSAAMTPLAACLRHLK